MHMLASGMDFAAAGHAPLPRNLAMLAGIYLPIEVGGPVAMQEVKPFFLGDWKVEPALNCICKDGVIERIDPRHMEVLLALVERQGAVVSQRELELAVWQSVVVANSSLYQSVAQLRKALGDDAKQSRYIQTIPRKGYRLVGQVRIADAAPDHLKQQPGQVDIQPAQTASAVQLPQVDAPRIVDANLLSPTGYSNQNWSAQKSAITSVDIGARKIGFQIFYLTAAAACISVAVVWFVWSQARPAIASQTKTTATLPNPQESSDSRRTDQQATGKALAELGRSYRQKHDPRAEAVLEQALTVQRGASETQWSTLATILSDLADVYSETEKVEQSKRAFTEARALFRQHGSERSLQYANLMSNLSMLENQDNNLKEARRLAAAALELAQSLNLQGRTRTELAEKQLRFAALAIWQDDYVVGEKAVRAAIDIYRQTVPDLDPARLAADGLLGLLLHHQGRINEAESLLERAVSNSQHVFGGQGPEIAEVLYDLSTVRFAQRRLVEAEQLVRDALRSRTPDNSESSDFTIGFLRTTLGIYLFNQDKMPEAESQLRQSLLLLTKAFPAGHAHIASAQHYLGEVLLAQGKLPEAEKLLTKAVDYCAKANAPAWRSARSRSALGEIRYRQQHFADAERQLVDSYHELADEAAVDYATKIRARERVVRFFSERGQQEYLRTLLATASTE
jgi:DNA-binding winged helix-turn-helix (wHTH) protein